MTVRNSDALATTDQMGFVAQDRQIKAAFDKGRERLRLTIDLLPDKDAIAKRLMATLRVAWPDPLPGNQTTVK